MSHLGGGKKGFLKMEHSVVIGKYLPNFEKFKEKFPQKIALWNISPIDKNISKIWKRIILDTKSNTNVPRYKAQRSWHFDVIFSLK